MKKIIFISLILLSSLNANSMDAKVKDITEDDSLIKVMKIHEDVISLLIEDIKELKRKNVQLEQLILSSIAKIDDSNKYDKEFKSYLKNRK